MTDDDILESRFKSPATEESNKSTGPQNPNDTGHVEATYIDMVDRMIDGGLVVDAADRVRLMRGEAPAERKTEKPPAPPDDKPKAA